METNNVVIICEYISEGGQGCVYRYKYLGKCQVIKIFTSPFKEYFDKEITSLELLNKSKLDGIPKLIDHFELTVANYIIDPSAPSSIYAWFDRNNSFSKYAFILDDLGKSLPYQGLMSVKNIKAIMYWLITLLKKIHELDIAHCDVKPDNIMFDSENYYLIDFGMSVMKGGDIKLPGLIGSEWSLPNPSFQDASTLDFQKCGEVLSHLLQKFSMDDHTDLDDRKALNSMKDEFKMFKPNTTMSIDDLLPYFTT